MTDSFAKYDECGACGLPRFMHTDFNEEKGVRSTADVARDCIEFKPHPDGWLIITRRTLICMLESGEVIEKDPHDLPVSEEEEEENQP